VNQGAQFVRHLENMLVLARVIAQGAKNRDESRGAHYKPDFPKRDDAELEPHDPRPARRRGRREVRARVRLRQRGQPSTSPTRSTSRLVAPRERKYEQAGAASAAATGKLEGQKNA
jgi:succinate dehydrogenase / fumarate reductase flavoprotein subunit